MNTLLEMLRSPPLPQTRPRHYYAALVDHCFAINRADLACELFERVTTSNGNLFNSKMGLSAPYQQMLRHLGRRGDKEGLVRMLLRMKENKIPMCEVTYGVAINAFGKMGELDMMADLFERMKRERIVPNSIHYTMIIDSYGKHGRLDTMVKVYEEMSQRRHLLSVGTYNSIIDNFGKKGDIVSMIKYYNAMKDHNIKPNETTYTSLISCYGKYVLDSLKRAKYEAWQAKTSDHSDHINGMLHEMMQLFQEIQQNGVQPMLEVYNMVIDVLGKCGKMDQMARIFSHLRAEPTIKPSKRSLIQE